MPNSDFKYYYIDHFFSKSLEEFIHKIKRGSAVKGNDHLFKFFRILRYFTINKLTYQKLKFLKNKLKINITFGY